MITKLSHEGPKEMKITNSLALSKNTPFLRSILLTNPLFLRNFLPLLVGPRVNICVMGNEWLIRGRNPLFIHQLAFINHYEYIYRAHIQLKIKEGYLLIRLLKINIKGIH